MAAEIMSWNAVLTSETTLYQYFLTPLFQVFLRNISFQLFLRIFEILVF